MVKVLGMKEPANTVTHLIPFIASILGLFILLHQSSRNVPQLVVSTIYGLSVVFLFGASSIYHWVQTTPDKELLLRKIDHMAIYILIAGSYTPVFYYGLKGVWQITMLGAVWLLALLGIFMKIWFMQIPRFVSTIFYVALGWIALVPFIQLIRNLPEAAMAMMVAGGVCYTVGAMIYARKRLSILPRRLGFHAVFHLFVAAGGVVHFLMMVLFIIPH